MGSQDHDFGKELQDKDFITLCHRLGHPMHGMKLECLNVPLSSLNRQKKEFTPHKSAIAAQLHICQPSSDATLELQPSDVAPLALQLAIASLWWSTLLIFYSLGNIIFPKGNSLDCSQPVHCPPPATGPVLHELHWGQLSLSVSGSPVKFSSSSSGSSSPCSVYIRFPTPES